MDDMSNKKFSLSKINLIMVAVAVVVLVVGFLLMSGVSSGDVYNPDIFAPRYITIGPMISLAGFVLMIVAILYKPRKK